MKPKEKKIGQAGRANLKVAPEVHREIDIESATRGIPIYALAEQAWGLYKASGTNLPLVETFIRFLKTEDAQTVKDKTRFLKDWELAHPMEVADGNSKEKTTAKGGRDKRKLSA